MIGFTTVAAALAALAVFVSAECRKYRSVRPSLNASMLTQPSSFAANACSKFQGRVGSNSVAFVSHELACRWTRIVS